MGIKSYKPVTPGLRHRTGLAYGELTGHSPHKPLLRSLPKAGGRTNRGRIASRHRGGGFRKIYRFIDFRRDKLEVPGVVETIEYDPNRSAFISLVKYADGERRYILAPLDLRVGQTITASNSTIDLLPGNSMPLRLIPQVRLPSSEIRNIHLDCRATIGQIGNLDHQNVSIGKAGRTRWLGWRPHVRGTAMNPVDHPHGGGEGKTKGGRHPVSPQGQPTKGYKTRNNKRTQRFIVRRRSK